MLEKVDTNHPAVIQLKAEATAYNKKKHRKRGLWSYKLYVYEDCLIMDNLWPALNKDHPYFPKVPYEPFGRELHLGALRAFEVASKYGLRLLIGQKYRVSFLDSFRAVSDRMPFYLKTCLCVDTGKQCPRSGDPIVNTYLEAQARKRTVHVSEES